MKLNSFWLWATLIAAAGAALTIFDVIVIN